MVLICGCVLGRVCANVWCMDRRTMVRFVLGVWKMYSTAGCDTPVCVCVVCGGGLFYATKSN